MPARDSSRKSTVHARQPPGIEELRRWVASPIEPRPRRNELLLKLFFGKHVPASHFIGVVEQVREQLARALEELAAAEEDARGS